MTHSFALRLANNIIEHLGVKLYQNQAPKVVAEYVANGWDAGADAVDVYLDAPKDPTCISVTDDGEGMTAEELVQRFLVIGVNRRTVRKKAAKNRKPMGRKGIGKFAGFGIARCMDVLTATDRQGQGMTFHWLRFELDDMLRQSEAGATVSYEPVQIGQGDMSAFACALERSGVAPLAIEVFTKNLHSGKSGTCVVLQQLAASRQASQEKIILGLANRFALNLIKDQLRVRVNDEDVAGIERLPKLQDFHIGNPEALCTETVMVDGQARPVQFWVGFVDTQKQNSMSLSAGVAVYAHNKLVQDRPFFFRLDSYDVNQRCLLGFVYADWLDDFDEDLVSTDRSSLNWDAPQTQALAQWGKDKVNQWLKDYSAHRTTVVREEVDADVSQTELYQQVTGVEVDALKELLREIYPGLTDNRLQRKKACEVMADAWMRKPMRITVKRLWEQLGGSDVHADADHYLKTVEALRESLAPEMLDVGVTVSMRLYAVRQMLSLVDKGASETHFQRLIEDFPWLLKPSWECLTRNQGLGRVVAEMQKRGELPAAPLSAQASNKRPDFVYLSDADTRHIVVIELKGAELDRQITISEYRQLGRYVDALHDQYPTAKVQGLLIGHSVASHTADQLSHKNVEMACWRDVLLEAARLHEEMLKTILMPVDAQREGRRLSLMHEFAAPELGRILGQLQQKGLMSPKTYDGPQPVLRNEGDR